jgi:Uma2 family endonuclease
MYQTTPQLMSFEEFLEWYPNDGRTSELINGVPIEMNPTGEQEEICCALQGQI